MPVVLFFPPPNTSRPRFSVFATGAGLGRVFFFFLSSTLLVMLVFFPPSGRGGKRCFPPFDDNAVHWLAHPVLPAGGPLNCFFPPFSRSVTFFFCMARGGLPVWDPKCPSTPSPVHSSPAWRQKLVFSSARHFVFFFFQANEPFIRTLGRCSYHHGSPLSHDSSRFEDIFFFSSAGAVPPVVPNAGDDRSPPSFPATPDPPRWWRFFFFFGAAGPDKPLSAR